jgi:hypothetical protein
VSIKQTEIGTIRSLENFMEIFLLPTVTVIVAHPVYDNIKAKLKAKVTNSIEPRVLLARVLLPT